MDISNFTYEVQVYEYFFNFTDEELYNLTGQEFQNFHPNLTNIGKSDYLLNH